jgi:ATP-dependent DNA helicase 2 subunit 1
MAGTVTFDASSKFEELRARVRRKEFKKRSHARISLFIGNNVEIGVRMYVTRFPIVIFCRYKLVHQAHKGTFLWLDSKTNQPTKTITKYVCEDTGTLLMDSQIKYAYVYGGEQIVFDKEEMTSIKNLDVQGTILVATSD